MKALILSDEINLFHWTVLKSALLILSLLPISHLFIDLWSNADASSQIMIGFLAISVFSAITILSFYSALKASVLTLSDISSTFEALLIKIYRSIPMLSLMAMLSYLTTKI